MHVDEQPDAPRWTHEPLEESLGAARTLTVSVVDWSVRAGWEDMARWAGIPRRRWRRHHPLADAAPVVAIVDGRPAFDAAAWDRFASLTPGAVALPTRTAAAHGVARTALRPPGRRPMRLVDLWRARRAARRLRAAERGIDAALAEAEWLLHQQVEQTFAAGDDGTPWEELPAYALAVRFDELVRWDGARSVMALVDLACGAVTGRLLHALVDRGMRPGEALLATAQLTATVRGRDVLPSWLDAADLTDDEWIRQHGWHALAGLQLEASPLREDPDAVRRWRASMRDAEQTTPRVSAVDPEQFGIEPNAVLAEVVERARRLTMQRELAGHLRMELHAALRALAWTLGRRLAADGLVADPDAVFDLTHAELVSVARGGAMPDVQARRRADAPADATSSAATSTGSTARQLRGIPASPGRVQARCVVLNAPEIDADVAGAVLVCRHTDPGWMPLLMRCAGLVTERGGPLSHAAIVARELGIPAVVGVGGARAALRTASTGTAAVDGAAGTVDLHG